MSPEIKVLYCNAQIITFWKRLKLWLINCKAVPEDYGQNIATVLGLRPGKTKFKKQINFCLLNARYYIWSCRTADNQPSLKQFLDQHKTLYSLEFNEAKNLRNLSLLLAK